MGTISLGTMINELKKHNKDLSVCFDFCQLTPAGLASYRGYYHNLAIGFTDKRNDFTQVKPVYKTVGELLTALEEAVGKTFTGWKGGEYKMERSTDVWVDLTGNSTGTAIIGFVADDYEVVIKTERVP